jgi:hypothetical protein
MRSARGCAGAAHDCSAVIHRASCAGQSERLRAPAAAAWPRRTACEAAYAAGDARPTAPLRGSHPHGRQVASLARRRQERAAPRGRARNILQLGRVPIGSAPGPDHTGRLRPPACTERDSWPLVGIGPRARRGPPRELRACLRRCGRRRPMASGAMNVTSVGVVTQQTAPCGAESLFRIEAGQFTSIRSRTIGRSRHFLDRARRAS